MPHSRYWPVLSRTHVCDPMACSVRQARHGEVPDAGALEAAKRQMRGGGIPLLVGATAVGSPDTVRALAASGVDGFATPLSALQALAKAADPNAARGSPEDCVASVLGAPSAAS